MFDLDKKEKAEMSLKVMTIVGTRPEIIKLSRIIFEIESCMKHVFVHTGQNYDYELNEIFFKDLEVRRPDHFLEVAAETAAKTIGNVISSVDDLLEKERPDAVLLYGDTNSCLSVIAAKRKKIPIFHLEAGNRCFDQRVPEEINRKIVDHLSDINMVHCEHSRRYLLDEKIKPETIIKTGTPMREVLEFYREKIYGSDVLSRLNLAKKDYFIVSAHREENIDNSENFDNMLDSFEKIVEKFGKKVIVSTHPRTRKKLETLGKTFSEKIEFMQPLGFFDYVKLQQEAYCVISDSGTITEESSILRFPAIMIRQAHERPEGMDVGAVVMSGLSAERVIDSIDIAIRYATLEAFRDIEDYRGNAVSKHVVKVIQSYTDYVNRTVWHK